MAETTWKQAVYDIADAYREAEGTSDKISIANLKEKVRDGGGKVYLDGERIKQLEMTSYKGDNPLTIGASGATFDANVLLQNGLTIVNGVNGEDLTDTASRQTTSVDILLREVKRKIADHKGEGEYVWKKCEITYEEHTKETYTNPSSVAYGDGFTAPVTVCSSDNYSYDPLTQTYTLEGDVQSFSITTGSAQQTSSDLYFIVGGTSGKEMIAKKTSTYVVAFTVSSGSLLFTCTSNTLYIRDSQEKYITLGYIVSSDPEAYPDGGEQDGYWYERVSELVVKTGTYTPSANVSTTLSIPHGLGETPKYVGINKISVACSSVSSPANLIVSANETNIVISGANAGKGISIKPSEISWIAVI